MRLRFMLFCIYILLGSFGAVQSKPELRVSVDIKSTYVQGQQDNINFTMNLNDQTGVFEEGVLFLNIVERDPAGKNPQAAHKIFTSAKETPKTFRQVYTGAELREGVSTTLEFGLRDGAKVGDYALVVQLFKGDETNPNRVKYENRVALKGFNFSITE